MPYTGHCLCGEISYEVDAELAAIQVCHCSQCQRAQGSAFCAVIPVETKHFKLLSGEASLQQYQSAANKFRVFCKHCGSPLYSKRSDLPDVIRLRIGSINEAILSKISGHAYVGSKANWHVIGDDAPQFTGATS